MEDSISPLHEAQNEFTENGKIEEKFLSDGSDDEGGFFTDSMLPADNSESTEEKGVKEKLDGGVGFEEGIGSEKEGVSEEEVVGSGLVSFNSLMEESRTQEIELSLETETPGNIEVTVGNPKKSAEGMGAHLVYPVNTKTTMAHFIKQDINVFRRFSDFLALYDNLVSIHQCRGVIIPLPPEKDMIGMTKMKISKDEEINNMEFVDKRRAALERFLTRVAKHPILISDKFFVSFLQVEGELTKPTGGGLLGAGIARWFGRVGESLTKITSALPEHDQWYEDRVELMEGTEHHLKELLTSTEILIQQRKELAQTTNQLSKAVGNLGSTEEDLSLSKVLSSLSEALDKVEKLRGSQDLQLLVDSIKDNITFIAALRLSMDERMRTHKTWKDSETTLAKKVDQKAKLENQKKTDKLEFASMEIHEWEEKVSDNKKGFEEISQAIKKEATRLDKVRLREIKATMLQCLRTNVDVHRQVASVWESFIPEITKDL